MKVQIMSDLHLEMNPCAIPVVGDVVVLAGDIHVGTEGLVLHLPTSGPGPDESAHDIERTLTVS